MGAHQKPTRSGASKANNTNSIALQLSMVCYKFFVAPLKKKWLWNQFNISSSLTWYQSMSHIFIYSETTWTFLIAKRLQNGWVSGMRGHQCWVLTVEIYFKFQSANRQYLQSQVCKTYILQHFLKAISILVSAFTDCVIKKGNGKYLDR